MEQGEHILELMDWDQAVPGLRQVTVIPMMSVYSEFLALQGESIENLCLEKGCSGHCQARIPTLLLGTDCSILHMLAAKCDCISDFSPRIVGGQNGRAKFSNHNVALITLWH